MWYFASLSSEISIQLLLLLLRGYTLIWDRNTKEWFFYSKFGLVSLVSAYQYSQVVVDFLFSERFGFKVYQPLLAYLMSNSIFFCEQLHDFHHHHHIVLATDIPDPLSPLLPIVHRPRQVFRTTSSILTQLLNVRSCWSSCFLRGRVWGSIRVHLLWVHLCFSSNVLHVWFA